jgi:hypothetical protein
MFVCFGLYLVIFVSLKYILSFFFIFHHSTTPTLSHLFSCGSLVVEVQDIPILQIPQTHNLQKELPTSASLIMNHFRYLANFVDCRCKSPSLISTFHFPNPHPTFPTSSKKNLHVTHFSLPYLNYFIYHDTISPFPITFISPSPHQLSLI